MPEWSTSVLEMTDGHGSITSLMWADQRSSRSRWKRLPGEARATHRLSWRIGGSVQSPRHVPQAGRSAWYPSRENEMILSTLASDFHRQDFQLDTRASRDYDKAKASRLALNLR